MRTKHQISHPQALINEKSFLSLPPEAGSRRLKPEAGSFLSPPPVLAAQLFSENQHIIH
jgi:hypothetical protein